MQPDGTFEKFLEVLEKTFVYLEALHIYICMFLSQYKKLCTVNPVSRPIVGQEQNNQSL